MKENCVVLEFKLTQHEVREVPAIINDVHNEGIRNIFDVTTANLKGQDKFDFWQHMARQAIVGVEVSTSRSAPFDIAATGVVQGGLTLARIQCEPCVIVRNPDKSLDSRADCVLLFFVKAGQLFVEQDGRSCLLNPGDGTTVVADRPYTLQTVGAHLVTTIRLPRTLIGQRSSLEQVTARLLREAKAPGQILFNFADQFCDAAPALDASVTGQLAWSFSNILGTAYQLLSNTTGIGIRNSSKFGTLDRAKVLIDIHLNDKRLTPAYVADKMRLSPRYLRKLFELDGTTMGRYILEQRLDRTASILMSPSHQQLPVKSIALTQGFKDLSHFSSAFRTRFHQSPTQYRERARQGLGATKQA